MEQGGNAIFLQCHGNDPVSGLRDPNAAKGQQNDRESQRTRLEVDTLDTL
jgi:hypothetical protein